jgi:hypothetical protein
MSPSPARAAAAENIRVRVGPLSYGQALWRSAFRSDSLPAVVGSLNETMDRRLSELTSEQRTEVEEASRLLRWARAGRQLPLTVKTSPAGEAG